MAYETNRFCWHGCISTDTETSKTFYSEVMGWKVETVPFGDDGEATFFKAQGKNLAHLASPPMEGVPSHWNNYLRVDDVDASTTKAVKNGGKEIVPGTDIPPGRFSVVASPSGATFSLFHEASADAEHHPGGTGSVCWVELHSQDLDADLKWLVDTFGFSTETMDMPDGPYTILTDSGQQRAGAMQAQSADMPSAWVTWIEVDNVDDTAARAKKIGGSVVVEPFDVPNIGRCAILSDTAGGVIGAIKSAS